MAKSGLWLKGARGKLAGVVAQKNNGQTILRELVIPANPRTNAQMAQRLVFSTVVQAAKQLEPIINHSFEGVAYGKLSRRKFIKDNIAIMRGYAASDFANAPTAAESEFFSTTKGVSVIVPNRYKVSEGSLVPGKFIDAAYDTDDGAGFLVSFTNASGILSGENITYADALFRIFGILPGQQLTKVALLVSRDIETGTPFVFNNDPDVAGWALRNARVVSGRIVAKSSSEFDFSANVPAVGEEQDAINYFETLLNAMLNGDKSDQALIDAVTTAAMITKENGVILLDQITGDVLAQTYGRTNEQSVAVATILSQLDGDKWLRSTSYFVTVPPMAGGMPNYGLDWNSAIQAWFQGQTLATDSRFLNEGGENDSI